MNRLPSGEDLFTKNLIRQLSPQYRGSNEAHLEKRKVSVPIIPRPGGTAWPVHDCVIFKLFLPI